MEYTFGRDDIGRYFAEFSMGHEAFGRWLNEELGQDPQRLEQLLSVIEQLHNRQIREYRLDGSEFSLELDREEVRVRAHSLDDSADDTGLEDLEFYDDELEAGCGLDDFRDVLKAWHKLITA
ncbi:YacL family protein [Marinobacterium rhizophilum]|uniref:YacL family protein n=1 Tax=Marinobacterium rhizophilum TaxID=420402 RepID=A0ABY5HG32_9GAMM|nr:YacL family protein [Marinobacterium rhizophilum]UTW11323.1 YacL family protein [Marinobacterium rhizophilum]